MTTIEIATATAAPDLPVHLSRFIGRERELSELTGLVQDTRLLTLTGAGGSGKTRLAREVAFRTSASFGRVGWVDLAPLATGDSLAQQVATALHIHERPNATPLSLLIESLRDERAVLVLDNCEHIVEASASLSEALLRACPRLTVIATSREALGVLSETAWLVPPLAAPEAIQLFTERACLALPTFTLNDANIGAVSEICRRLDGIPLAIELAAARVRVLTPDQIASRLDDAFRLLTTGSRTALPRHRTLRATMDWSFSLLGTREQVLLRRLSVFAGTFALEAAEFVCVGDPLDVEDILDGVAGLVDKSLIVMGAGEGVARYRLLETVRQYGAERLAQANEGDAVALRFATQCIATIEPIAPLIVGGPAKPGLIERLSAEHDNIRAAATWACGDPSRAELAMRFVGGLGWFWYAVGQFREARQFADRALSFDTSHIDPLIVGRAHLASALTAFFQGELDRASVDFQAALPLLRATGDAVSLGTALAKYGAARLLAGEIDASVVILDEAMTFIRDTPRNDITRIFAIFWRGLVAYAQGDLEMSRGLFRECLAIGRDYQLPTTTGHALSTCAMIELALGNIEAASALVAEAIEIEVANRDGWGVSHALDVATRLVAARGQHDDAARLIGAVDAHRDRMAVAIPGIAPRERDALIATLRSTKHVDFDARYAEGQAWTTEQTVAMALEEAMRTAERLVPSPAIVTATVPASDTARLRVLALGSLQVFIDNRQLDTAEWGSARPRELLVYLMMHPEGRTKEQVGLAFWPEASSGQLRNNFHVTLHRLRKVLGDADTVTHAGERYRIEPALIESFDVAEFEREMADAMRAVKRKDRDAMPRVEHALARFRGDFLDGEPFGDWHLEHRAHLQRLYIDGLMRLGALCVGDERYSKAAEAFRRVLARDDLNEEATIALMRCHAAVGERAQAVRIYRRFADRLRAELGAKPSDAAIEFSQELLHGAG